MQTLSDLRSRPHTSISAIKCFIQCPRQFRLRYIDKIKPAFRSAFFAFGTAWHDVVDHWLTSNASQDELRQRLRDKLTVLLADEEIVFDDEDESAESLVDMSLRMLDIFLVKVSRPEKTIAVEVPFSLELAHRDRGGLAGQVHRQHRRARRRRWRRDDLGIEDGQAEVGSRCDRLRSANHVVQDGGARARSRGRSPRSSWCSRRRRRSPTCRSSGSFVIDETNESSSRLSSPCNAPWRPASIIRGEAGSAGRCAWAGACGA